MSTIFKDYHNFFHTKTLELVAIVFIHFNHLLYSLLLKQKKLYIYQTKAGLQLLFTLSNHPPTMKNLNQTTGTKEEIILLSEENDRNYWANRLGVSSEALKSAVRATRSITLDQITAYLNQQKKTVSIS